MAPKESECPLCASRNVSFSEREHALVCRDCGSVVAGKPVVLPQAREEVVREIIPDLNPRARMAAKKALAKKSMVKKVAKVKKAAKAKPKKKVAKKAPKKSIAKKKVVKKAKAKPKKKSFMHRLMRR